MSQYRWYFPPDFESSQFLLGRQATFHGVYRWAFYLHILSGPIAVVFAGCLVVSGGHGKYRTAHRIMGRVLAAVVILGLLPSGIVMARHPFTGELAAWGFILLAGSTAWCTIMAVIRAMKKQFQAHRIWALRSFILLCSPMLLRFASSALAALNVDAEWTYPWNAWLSWLIPILIFELARKR